MEEYTRPIPGFAIHCDHCGETSVFPLGAVTKQTCLRCGRVGHPAGSALVLPDGILGGIPGVGGLDTAILKAERLRDLLCECEERQRSLFARFQ